MSPGLDLCVEQFPGWVDLPFRIHAWVIPPVSPRLAETGTVSAWFLGLMRSNYALNEVIHVCHFVCIFFSIHLLLDLFLNCKLVSSRLLCLKWFGNQKKSISVMFSSEITQAGNLIECFRSKIAFKNVPDISFLKW